MTQTTMPEATVAVDNMVTPATAGRITLDEAWSPYAAGTVTVPLTGVDLAALDARQDRRVQVSLIDMQLPDPTPRLFDLGLRGRRIDHKQRTVDLDVASDEAMLFDTCRLATTASTGARAFESSLRGICDWALGQVPGVLRNLEPNPAALSTGSTAPYGSRYGWTRAFTVTGAPPDDAPSSVARFTSTEAGTLAGRGVDSYGNPDLATPGTSGIWTEGPQVTPGETITVSRYVRMGGTSRFALSMRFHDGTGNWVGAKVGGGAATELLANNWFRVVWTGVVPDAAKYFSASLINTTAEAITVGTIMDVTGLMTARTDRLGEWREKALLSGPDDADMTAQWDATNLLLNPNAATSAAEWNSYASATTIAWNNGAGVASAGFIRASQTAATGAVALTALPSNLTASAGGMHTASVYVRAGTGTITARVNLRYFDADNRILKDIGGPPSVIGTAWGRIAASPSTAAPANTARITAWVFIEGSAAGRTWDLDQGMLTEGPLLMDYFDGNTTDTANYTYSWDGAANASASLRVATPERLPELFDWKPGQSLWDFLRPFLESAGLRLFCDEQRDWRVIDPTSYQVPGTIFAIATATGEFEGNTVTATDTISRDRTDWATGVVVQFTWRDQSGRTREAFDVAGTPGKVILVDRNTAPLKGAAATILARISARGASQDLTVIENFIAAPGMFTSVSMIDTPDQTGRVSRASFDLHSGLIDFTTRDMEDS